MRLLLDTNALLFALTEPNRLGDEAKRSIKASATELLVSSASAWEIATKHRLGELPHADAIVAAFDRNLRTLGSRELAITTEHALLAGGLDWAHRDPFDRMIAAQAILEGLPLATSDLVFKGLPGVRVIW